MFDVMAPETQRLTEELQPQLTATVLRLDEPLAKKTTLRVGGPADIFAEPSSEQDLACIVRFCHQRAIPLMLLGRGSNLLISDEGVRGLVVSLAHPYFSEITVHGQQLRCGAGARLKAVSAKARENNLAGLEFLEGIPGSVGGALRMNAGAMGSAAFDVLDRVRFMDGQGSVRECVAAEIPFEYRSCALFKTHFVLAAVFHGRPDAKNLIAERIDTYNKKRWQSQPKEPSAGCIFKNPSAELPAGKLIDELGLKGTGVGGASVSQIHGNFIINDGTATANDVLELIQIIKTRALEQRGIELHTEVQIIGEQ